MKHIAIILLAGSILLTGCNIDREPYSAMGSGQITGDPSASLDPLLNGAYA